MAAVTLADVAEVVVVVVEAGEVAGGAAGGAASRSGRVWPLRRGELTLAAQVLLLQLVVILVLLLAVGVLAVRQATDEFAEEQGAQMRSAAEYTATIPGLRASLQRAADAPGDAAVADALPLALAPYADAGASLAGATEVAVIGPDRRVLGATEPSRVGRRADLGDSDALRGRGWSGDVRVAGERRVAAHAPVIGDDGTLLGIVTAEETYPSPTDRVADAGPALLPFLALGAGLGLIGTWLVARLVRRSTRGLGPSDLAHLADQREALLHAIREGVVGVGTDGRVTVMNDAARAALGVDRDPVGLPVDGLGLDGAVVALLTDPDAEVADAVAVVGSRVLVLNRRAASAGGLGIGTVTTLRDRTELIALRTQLSSNLSITDTLRAQTHEFDNRLHTISGLVQLGEYDEVAALVGSLSRERAEIGGQVTARLADPHVAALVVAKHAVAAERGVVLELDPGSRLPTLTPDLSADLTTVVGNLVDNAVDAAAGGGAPLVELWIRVEDDAVRVRVRDNGPGVPPESRDRVFARGFSTKAPVVGGRGIGLALVRALCVERGGEVVIDDAGQGGRGAEVRVVLPLTAPDAPIGEDGGS